MNNHNIIKNEALISTYKAVEQESEAEDKLKSILSAKIPLKRLVLDTCIASGLITNDEKYSHQHQLIEGIVSKVFSSWSLVKVSEVEHVFSSIDDQIELHDFIILMIVKELLL